MTGDPLDGIAGVEALGERMDEIVAAEIMAAPSRWPFGRTLPVVRVVDWDGWDGEIREVGTVIAGLSGVPIPAVLDVYGVVRMRYPDFEAMASDGWRPD